MPAPIKVRLLPHDRRWAARAEAEAGKIRAALNLPDIEVHHIGSTAIPGIQAKPIIDLLLAVPDLGELDRSRAALEAAGYQWHGEHGLAGRRYFTFDDPRTGARLVQLHGFAAGDEAIARHLAFRDYLRDRPELAMEYQHEKQRCAALHPTDSHAYSDCKCDWIRRVEAEALAARNGASAG